LSEIKVYKKLEWLNNLPVDEAERVFADCCGSRSWARQMAAARPFPMLEHLFKHAGQIWRSLAAADWLEAFAAHPKIGSAKPAPVQHKRAADWSAGEQSGLADAAEDVRRKLAEANELYERRFGFIFIVCATGKSAGEMLAICEERLKNSAADEIANAAAEQQKITEIRLAKLLER